MAAPAAKRQQTSVEGSHMPVVFAAPPNPVRAPVAPVYIGHQQNAYTSSPEYFLGLLQQIGPSVLLRDLLVSAATRDNTVAATIDHIWRHPHRPHQPIFEWAQHLAQPPGYYHPHQKYYPQQPFQSHAPQAIRSQAPGPVYAYAGGGVPGHVRTAGPPREALPTASDLDAPLKQLHDERETIVGMQAMTQTRLEQVDRAISNLMREQVEIAGIESRIAELKRGIRANPVPKTLPKEKNFVKLLDKAEVAMGYTGRFDRMSCAREANVAMDVEHKLGEFSATMVAAMTEPFAHWGTKKNAVSSIIRLFMIILEAPIGECKKHNTNFHYDLANNFLKSVEILTLQQRSILALDDEFMRDLDALLEEARENAVEDSMNVLAVKALLEASVEDDDDEDEEGEGESEGVVEENTGSS